MEILGKRVEESQPLIERVDILESQVKRLERLNQRVNEVEQYGWLMYIRFNNIEVSWDNRKESCKK